MPNNPGLQEQNRARYIMFINLSDLGILFYQNAQNLSKLKTLIVRNVFQEFFPPDLTNLKLLSHIHFEIQIFIMSYFLIRVRYLIIVFFLLSEGSSDSNILIIPVSIIFVTR